jgi:dienelactone hydrolase
MLLFVAALLAGAIGDPFLARTFEVRVTKDVAYRRAPVRQPVEGRKELQLDLYEPEGTDTLRLKPGFITIHGGGLRRGDKATENMTQLCEEMAARGFVCASINYRLQDDDPPGRGPTLAQRTLAAAMEDAHAAVRWLKKNSRRYKVDARRIAIGGSSAGATIALRVTFGREGRQLSVPAAFSWSGGLYTSPEYVAGGAASLLIVHGDSDTDVDPQEVRDLAQYGHRAGLRTVTYFCADLGHNVPLDRRVRGKALYDHLAAFLYEEMELHRMGKPLVRSRRSPMPAPDVRSIPCPR